MRTEDRPGPLAGLRVVELGGLGPAPFCAMLLADLGADVVRVERSGSGDAVDPLNRGKRLLPVDLNHARGAEVVLALAEHADVVVEGFRPGVAERMGVGPRRCHERNPRLVYGRMTGWGQEGPLAGRAGHDINFLALSGMLHAIGRAGGPPQVPVNLLGDFGGGALYLAVGVLAACWEAKTSGYGQTVDASIVDGSAHLGTLLMGMLSAGQWRTERGTNLIDTGAPFYDVYETADGEYVAVGALETKFYDELLTKLGLLGRVPDRRDRENWPELRQRFAEVFAQRTRAQWQAVFSESDACVAPVLSVTEAADHPHVRARQTLARHAGTLRPAPAPRFSRTPNPEHSWAREGREVLAEWRIPGAEELLESGAI